MSFTIAGNIAELVTAVPATPFAFQVVLEPLNDLPHADVLLGALDANGDFTNASRTGPLAVPVGLGVVLSLRTLPDTFAPIRFPAPADGTTITSEDIAAYADVPGEPIGPGFDSVTRLIEEGDDATLDAARAYADTIGGGSGGAVVHEQTTPAATWSVPHAFGRVVDTTIYVGGEQVETDVWSSDTLVVVTFPSPTVGTLLLR